MEYCRRNWWNRTSLRFKLTASVIAMTVPLIGMLLYNNFYAIHVVRRQVFESNKNMLTLYLNEIDTSLSNAGSYMDSVAVVGSDLVSLGQAKTEDKYYQAKIFLFNKLNNDISLYRAVDSFFVYDASRQDFMICPGPTTESFATQNAISRKVVHVIRSRRGFTPNRWTYFRIGSSYYLMDVVKSGTDYLGAWVKTDELLTPLRSVKLGRGGGVMFINDHGVPISDTNFVEGNNVSLKQTRSGYVTSGTSQKYLVVQIGSTVGDFRLAAIIVDKHILANLPYLQRFIWLVTALGLIFVPVGLYSIRQTALKPLKRLEVSMNAVRGGDWSTRVEMIELSKELRLVGESFNSMMAEIERLRVDVYEEQLNRQREELGRLQLQVNPHFYLNSLNVVYNMAKLKKFNQIMEMTMSLVQYFRFMFSSNTSYVRLRDELTHTENYLLIQSLRYLEQLTWTVQAPDYLMDSPIPPLAIQTFVENSIKHGVTMDDPIHISVVIDLVNEEDSDMRIVIQDNGNGFGQEVIHQLQAGESVENEQGEHIGIWNVQRRLMLLYNQAVTIRYYNDDETNGAVVEIVLPSESVKEHSCNEVF